MNSIEVERFEAAAMPHVNALFQTALRFTEKRGDAEEVVSETYVCAMKSFDSSKERTDWRVRLFKILMEKIHHRNRRSIGARIQALQATSDWAKESDVFSCPPEQIVSVLDSIPITLREVIVLVDCQDFSYREASDILNLRREVVGDRLRLGRRHLRSKIAQDRLSGVPVAH
jgi:RNA polymerase sigma-70 factor (ECF subfamily)